MEGDTNIMVINLIIPERIIIGTVLEGEQKERADIPFERVPEEALNENQIVEYRIDDDGMYHVEHRPEKSAEYIKQLREREEELCSRLPTTPDRFDG